MKFDLVVSQIKKGLRFQAAAASQDSSCTFKRNLCFVGCVVNALNPQRFATNSKVKRLNGAENQGLQRLYRAQKTISVKQLKLDDY